MQFLFSYQVQNNNSDTNNHLLCGLQNAFMYTVLFCYFLLTFQEEGNVRQ